MARTTHLSLYGSVRRVPYFLAGSVPDAFSFTAVSGVALSATDVESNIVTLTGLGEPVTVSVSGDASVEYRKNGGAWATIATTGDSGDTFQLRLDASASYNTGVSGFLDVGGFVAEFQVTTLRQVIAPTTRAPRTRLHSRR